VRVAEEQKASVQDATQPKRKKGPDENGALLLCAEQLTAESPVPICPENFGQALTQGSILPL
jgi:hypothetical protein